MCVGGCVHVCGCVCVCVCVCVNLSGYSHSVDTARARNMNFKIEGFELDTREHVEILVISHIIPPSGNLNLVGLFTRGKMA